MRGHTNTQRGALDDLSDLAATIPKELQQIPQWIVWRAGVATNSGKFAKIPVGKNGSSAAWTTSEQWFSFHDAVAYSKNRGFAGVGLVLPAQTADGRHVVALDLDDVDLDDRDSPRMLEIQRMHKTLGSPYVEQSPSGRGLRMFVLSQSPVTQYSNSNPLGGKDEVFCSSPRWVTVTGEQLGGAGVPDATWTIKQAIPGLVNPKQKSQFDVVRTGRSDSDGVVHDLKWNGWPAAKIRDGDGREALMLSYAGHLRAQGHEQHVIERMCLQANAERYEHPLDADTVVDRARRYAEQPELHPVQYDDADLQHVDQTDAGNVARLYEITDGNIRYVFEQRVWIYWDGRRWEYDDGKTELHRNSLMVAGSYMRKVKRIQKEIDDPSSSPDQKKALTEAVKSLEKWIVQCRNKSRIDAMIGLAETDKRFVVFANRLDCDPLLLGVANGVVCLRTGALIPDSRKNFILKRSTVTYDPKAPMDLIKSFIEQISAIPDGLENGKVKSRPRPQLAEYLQRLCGYCLSGLTVEQVMFMFRGNGANGKNVLVDILKYVMGTYAEVVQPEILLTAKTASNAEQASPNTRKLAGIRCAITSESKSGAQLDVAVIKRHTGDSEISARGLFEKPVTFTVTHKLVFLTNHAPLVDHMDDAIKGRLHVIPFDMSWNRPGATDPDPTLPDADKDLLSNLKKHADGVLRFFVEGSVSYFRDGLLPPPEVTSFTRSYIIEQDTVRLWLAEECVQCQTDEGLTAAQLYLSYSRFCSAEGERAQCDSAASLGRMLKHMGYESKRTRDGRRYALKNLDSGGT